MSGDTLPERLLELKSRCCNVSMVNSSSGTVPVIPMPGNESMATSLLVLHVTPVQLHGLESVATQFGSRSGPWGTTADLNASRATMSVLRP